MVRGSIRKSRVIRMGTASVTGSRERESHTEEKRFSRDLDSDPQSGLEDIQAPEGIRQCSTEFGSEARFEIQNHRTSWVSMNHIRPWPYNHYDRVGSYQLIMISLNVDDSNPNPQLQVPTSISRA